MTLKNLQFQVDNWIATIGGKYFDVKTNMIILMEEVGELSSVIARKYGDQVPKSGDKQSVEDEIGDVLWVLTCISNQLDLNLEEVMKKNLAKKSKRDKRRFK